MWDEAVGDSLAALKLIPDWFVTSKMIKNLLASLYADENMIYFDEDSGNVPTGINNGTGILNKDFNNINLDNNFEEDGPDTIILIRLFASQINFKNATHFTDKWRINANSVASRKLLEFLHIRRREKTNRTNSYIVMLLVWIQFDSIERLCHLIEFKSFCEYLVILI